MASPLKPVARLLNGRPKLKLLEHETRTQNLLLRKVRERLPGELAKHCTAARLDDDRLVLHTDSPVWASRLRFLANQLRILLQNDYPALREVKVKLLPQRSVQPRKPPHRRRSALAAGVVGDTAAHLQPGPLRLALERLAKTLARDDGS